MTTSGFEFSRRLGGHNPYFDGPGAALETCGGPPSPAELAAWRDKLSRLVAQLGWPPAPIHSRQHATGATLAFAGPIDQLLSATELNEWAWRAVCHETHRPIADASHAPGHPAAWDESSAARTLKYFSAAERDPALCALADAARERDLPLLIDDEQVSVGSGARGRSWARDALPDVAQVPWSTLGRIPVALVTGTNGKTTTVRLLAALLAAHGQRVALSCTDGLFIGSQQIEAGDYSGPIGARTLLRRQDIDAAVLETARGGILRRGLALDRADVAIVTNISGDHFGEYGVHNLDDLADAKLTVARTLAPPGWLILNADDALLVRRGLALDHRRAWFALDPAALPEPDAPHALVVNGALVLGGMGQDFDLGAVTEMPLSFGGHARHNIANLAAAALAAALLGVPPASIAKTLRTFGSARDDNPGRLQHWRVAGVDVLLDYAHNPSGLAALLDIAGAVARGRGGRLGLLLGAAGDRADAELSALAAAALIAQPSKIVLKDTPAYLRGRAPGEVPSVLRAALITLGADPTTLALAPDEMDGSQQLLQWAAAGDVVLLPVLDIDTRVALGAALDARAAQ